jgi:hypothetical protein
MTHSTHNGSGNGSYQRYHIDTRDVPDNLRWPSRFKVRVNRTGLLKLLIREMVEYRGDLDIMLSRPCMYGVFSGPIGGFAPRENLCVGCLRCTTQYPDFVSIEHNPARQALGDSYFHFNHVNAVTYEAQTGSVPVKGAGYRGQFGGQGWDGMWTDMSEIVRPTRDGIHGREFISTSVDIGSKSNFLTFNEDGKPVGGQPSVFSLPLPMLFDSPADHVASPDLYRIFSQTAEAVETLLMTPLRILIDLNLHGSHIVPLVTPRDIDLIRILPFTPRLIMLDGWPPNVDDTLYQEIKKYYPDTLIGLRTRFLQGEDLLAHIESGIHIFHLTASYHGRSADDEFVFDLIRAAHKTLVDAGIREEITLLGSGGIIAAEHVPKAIIAGLDAVVLDTPLLVALQARFQGDFIHRRSSSCQLPRQLDTVWGQQRLKNLMAAWRDQLLEILGAMGLREVRRLRGEIGRAMFQADLEQEAFGDIEGYPNPAAGETKKVDENGG